MSLAQSIADGNKGYSETQKNLETAIRDYDQAVLHLAARAVAGGSNFAPISDCKI